MDRIQPPYDHFLPIVRFYWHSIMKTIAQMVEAIDKDLILDFGCGEKKILRKYLPGYTIVGYDIIPEYSDVRDYRNLHPHTIICSNTLEHLEKEELLEVMRNFKKMKPRFLLTAQPTENFLIKICNLITMPHCLDKNFNLKEHKLRIKEVHNILSDFFKLKDRKGVFSSNIISKWIIE